MDVKHDPRKEVIIHEISKFETPQELVNHITKGARGPVPPLQWTGGVVLTFNAMPITDHISKEITEGKLHWDYCACALMEEYQDNMNNSENTAVVSIQDVSINETFVLIARFLRDEILNS